MSSSRRSKKEETFYIPVGLTTFQKDLIEILVSIHAHSFQNESKTATPREQDSSKSSVSSSIPQTLSDRQMNYIFDTNIRSVINHPSLLVDHYMPRQFLRMEPNERLINTSGKFKVFQQLLFKLLDKEKDEVSKKVLLISHSIKELDILEGFLLGQKVRIKRISGTSLYDEGHPGPVAESLSLSSSSSSESNVKKSRENSSTPISSTSSQSNTNVSFSGYSKDGYSYTKKRKLNPHDIDQVEECKSREQDCLLLATTTHLKNDEDLLKDFDIDIIISFDPMLDPLLTAIDKKRYIKDTGKRTSSHRRIIPIIKMLVLGSPDHFILCNSDGEKETYEFLKASLDYFLKTRTLKREDVESLDLTNFKEALFGEPDVTCNCTSIPPLESFPHDADVDYLTPKFSPLQHSSDKDSQTLCVSPLSLKSYQEELMRRSMQRFDQLKKEIKENDKILRINRLKETTRQNEIDVLKNDIGIIFKKFQESEISETGLKKRLERLLGESIKLDKSNTVLEGQLEELTGLVSLTDESNIDSKLAEYTRDNTFKDIKLNELTVDNKAKTTKNDDLRMEYQTKSTIAVEKAQTLQDLKRIKKETEERKNGPLNTMTNLEPLLSREKKLKGDLESLVQNSKFLKDLIKSLNDKYPIIGGKESSSSSTSLRDNAGNGNGRYRSRRGNTPNYTR